MLFLGTNDQFETTRRNAVVSLFPVFVRSAAVYKFLHVLKETHYRYNSIRINQNSLSTNEMDNFGAQALQTAEVLDDMNYMDLENFGTGDVAKSRVVDMEPGLDTNTTYQVDVASLVFLSNLEKDALPQQQPIASSINLSVLQFAEKNVFPLRSTSQHAQANEPSNTCHNNSELDVHVHRTTDTPTNEFSENNVLFLEVSPRKRDDLQRKYPK